jgi:hypothetical protein
MSSEAAEEYLKKGYEAAKLGQWTFLDKYLQGFDACHSPLAPLKIQ